MSILNSRILVKELERIGDDFITVKIQDEDREYIIDNISHVKNYTDSPLSHLCLVCRDGGQCEIRR